MEIEEEEADDKDASAAAEEDWRNKGEKACEVGVACAPLSRTWRPPLPTVVRVAGLRADVDDDNATNVSGDTGFVACGVWRDGEVGDPGTGVTGSDVLTSSIPFFLASAWRSGAPPPLPLPARSFSTEKLSAFADSLGTAEAAAAKCSA